MSSLITENGTELEVKEGIVLDAEGTPLHAPFARASEQGPQSGPKIHTVQFGGTWAPLLFFPLVALVMTFGLTLLAGFAVLFIAGWILLSAKRILFPR
jgi:hypothetical protein